MLVILLVVSLINSVYSSPFKCNAFDYQNINAVHFPAGEMGMIWCINPKPTRILLRYNDAGKTIFRQAGIKGNAVPFAVEEHIYILLIAGDLNDVTNGGKYLDLIIDEDTDYSQYKNAPIDLSPKAKLVETTSNTKNANGGAEFVDIKNYNKVKQSYFHQLNKQKKIQLTEDQINWIVAYQKLLNDLKEKQKSLQLFRVKLNAMEIYYYHPYFARDNNWMRVYFGNENTPNEITTNLQYWGETKFTVQEIQSVKYSASLSSGVFGEYINKDMPKHYIYKLVAKSDPDLILIMTPTETGYIISKDGKQYPLFWEVQVGGWCGMHTLNNFIKAEKDAAIIYKMVIF